LIVALQETVAEQTAEITDLQQKVQGLLDVPAPPCSAVITEVTQGHVTIVLHGAGTYPVMVTLYGSGLKANGVRVSASANYSIIMELPSSNNMMLVEILKPKTKWEANTTLELILLDAGTVTYASADVGVGKLT